MRIVLHEMKKIWRPSILLALVVLGVLFGYVFLSFDIKYFPNGHPSTEYFELARSWTTKYGTTMEEPERQDAAKELSALYAEADGYIKSDQRFAAVGIYSYKDVRAYSEADDSQRSKEKDQAYWLLFTGEAKYRFIGFRIQTLETALEAYTSMPGPDDSTQFEKNRIAYITDSKLINGILPYEVPENQNDYSKWCATFLILSLIILLSPLLVRDRMTGVRQLQWSSRKGRRIIRPQFLAIVLSAILLVLAELTIMISVYATLGTQFFWNNPLISFLFSNVYWFDLTYGQYVVRTVGLAVLFAFGAAGIAFFLSRFSGNYITLLLKAVPVFVALALLWNKVILYLFSFANPLYRLTNIVGAEIYCSVLIFIIGLLLSIIALRRERKCEAKDA
jgi:hypothetical protein